MEWVTAYSHIAAEQFSVTRIGYAVSVIIAAWCGMPQQPQESASRSSGQGRKYGTAHQPVLLLFLILALRTVVKMGQQFLHSRTASENSAKSC